MHDSPFRIYASRPRRPALVRPSRPPIAATPRRDVLVIESVEPAPPAPPPAPPPPPEPVASAAPIAIVASPIDHLVIDVLASAPEPGETIDAAYRRKERDLGQLFASLTRAEASVLHRRLSDPDPGDGVAAAFARLVVDRRTRLLAFLAEAPRREHLQGTRISAG